MAVGNYSIGLKIKLHTNWLKRWVHPSELIPRDDFLNVVSGGANGEIRGTYGHPLLAPHIASWTSPVFAVKVSHIVNDYIVRSYIDQIRINVIGNKFRLRGITEDEMISLLSKVEKSRVSKLDIVAFIDMHACNDYAIHYSNMVNLVSTFIIIYQVICILDIFTIYIYNLFIILKYQH